MYQWTRKIANTTITKLYKTFKLKVTVSQDLKILFDFKKEAANKNTAHTEAGGEGVSEELERGIQKQRVD